MAEKKQQSAETGKHRETMMEARQRLMGAKPTKRTEPKRGGGTAPEDVILRRGR